MAETRQKTHSIMLVIGGKRTTMELFDAGQWPTESSIEGHWRLRVEGKWLGPARRLAFYTPQAIGRLVADALNGTLPSQVVEDAPALAMHQRVRVECGEAVEGLPCDTITGWVATPPYLGHDGRWHVFVTSANGTHAYPAHDVSPLAPARKRRGKP